MFAAFAVALTAGGEAVAASLPWLAFGWFRLSFFRRRLGRVALEEGLDFLKNLEWHGKSKIGHPAIC